LDSYNKDYFPVTEEMILKNKQRMKDRGWQKKINPQLSTPSTTACSAISSTVATVPEY
jgi:hypothetical protein